MSLHMRLVKSCVVFHVCSLSPRIYFYMSFVWSAWIWVLWTGGAAASKAVTSVSIYCSISVHCLSYARLHSRCSSIQALSSVPFSARLIRALNLSSRMSRCVCIVSQPRSNVQVSLAVLCGVRSRSRAALRCRTSRSAIALRHASGMYHPSVP